MHIIVYHKPFVGVLEVQLFLFTMVDIKALNSYL